MTAVQWQFLKMPRGFTNQQPMEAELLQGELNVRLAREVIQNSLDAGIEKVRGQSQGSDGPVRVRFSLAGINNPLPAERAERYFAGLPRHLNAVAQTLDSGISNRLEQNNLLSAGVPFLVVEDSRTVGLEGDWRLDNEPEDGTANSNFFYWFFRNVGRSGKGPTDNGSWGLGKWVFPGSSGINSHIAVTKRAGDAETLLMGQTVLTKHTIDGRAYLPYGFFAEHETDGFQVPLQRSNPEHADFIRQCIDDFGLRYRQRNVSGLSVIIPFPQNEGELAAEEVQGLTKDGLLTAVVDNYFHPIITNRLEVVVDGGDGSPPVQLTDETIDGVLQDLPLAKTGERSVDSYQKLFAMGREIAGLPSADYVNLSAPPDGDESYVHYKELAELRPDYEAGKLLAFRIRTDVQRRGEEQEDTHFHLYVQRDDTLPRGHDYYVRGTLSIPDMDLIKRHRARALLVVNERQALAAMLRDSEPPAHNTWRPQVDRVGKRWIAAPRRINSVRNSPAQLLRILETAPEGLQKDALADIFYWDRRWGVAQRPAGPVIKDEKSKYKVDRPDPPQPGPAEFAIDRVDSGFRVRCSAGMAESGPLTARLQAAYVTPAGNPLLRYQELDFQLHGDNALAVAVAGGDCRPGGKGNELLLTISDPAQFALTAQGFDPQRDVHVRVERGGAAAEEGDDDPGV